MSRSFMPKHKGIWKLSGSVRLRRSFSVMGKIFHQVKNCRPNVIYYLHNKNILYIQYKNDKLLLIKQNKIHAQSWTNGQGRGKLADLMKKLGQKCHIKLRVLREKPRFVFWYVMDALFTWVLGLTISIIGLVLFPALASPGSVSSVKLPPFSEIVNVDKAGQIIGNVIEKLRQFNLSGLIGIVKEIPDDFKRLLVKLCEFVKRWRELLGQFIAVLLTPSKVWEKLQALWERYKVKIKIVTTKALGIAISFVLFKLLLYAAPRLGKGIMTIWGVNAGVLALQWCIAFVAPKIARRLRGALENMWFRKEQRKLHEKGETLIGNVRSALDANKQDAKAE